jgi:hypothetical protein
MKYDAMRWSSQLESACSILAAHNEAEGDRVLVALARLAKVALDAGDIYREVSDNPDTTIHPAFSIAPLKCSLNHTKEMLTAEQLQHSKSPIRASLICCLTTSRHSDHILVHRRSRDL